MLDSIKANAGGLEDEEISLADFISSEVQDKIKANCNMLEKKLANIIMYNSNNKKNTCKERTG